MKLVLVQWEDSTFSPTGWHSKDEYYCIGTNTTAGILRYEDDKQVIIGQSINKEQSANETAILKSTIRRMWKLKTQ